MKIIICPNCGSDEIKRVRRKWIGKSQGKTYSVPDLEFYECPRCGERVYEPQAIRKIESYSPTFSKKHTERRIA